MNVGSKSPNASFMDRNVRQDYLISVSVFLNYVGSNIVEIRKVIFNPKDVMITLDKHETPAKTGEVMQATSVNGNIAK